ncbi:MAG TPA: hypothetical protein VF765_08190 [Polyangiaceae bacterium]
MKLVEIVAFASLSLLFAPAAGCGSSSTNGGGTGSGSSSGGTTNTTGQTCTSPSQCYRLVADGGAVHGTITCLMQGVPNGYCTHTCTQDTDCCAVPGECPYGYPEVCASYESTGQKYCFLSCAASVISSVPDAGTTDPTTYCQRYANSSFTCRSTGGGAQNQQFCGP